MTKSLEQKYVFDIPLRGQKTSVGVEYENITNFIQGLNDRKVGWPVVNVIERSYSLGVYEIVDPLHDERKGHVRVGRGNGMNHITVEESIFDVVETALRKSDIVYISRKVGTESGRFSVTPYNSDTRVN